MDYSKEIILIYSEEDNQPLGGGEKGWVTNFHKFFTILLQQITAEDVSLKLVTSTNFSTSQLEKAASVLILLTPNLMKEDKIINTISGWVQMSDMETELKINGLPRVFKLLKRQFDADADIPELSEFSSYNFFYFDSLTGEPMEFIRFFGADAERGYWMKLIDLAYDVNDVINNIFHGDSIPIVKSNRDTSVYLASTGVDLSFQRDEIKRELQRHGFEVYPKKSLPKELDELEAAIRDNLSNASLSIHMIGEDYGQKINTTDFSLVDLENRLADEHIMVIERYNKKARKPRKFSRLIWVSPELKNITERQKIFIENLKGLASKIEDSEVLQVPLSELKSVIREELVTGGRFRSRHDSDRKDDKEDQLPKVYLIHDKSDQEGAKQVEEYLKSNGLEVLLPSFEGEPVDIRFVHQENLKACDGSLIYFENASPAWIQTKLQDLLKSPGFGRKKPMIHKGLYVVGQNDLDQLNIEKYRATVMQQNGEFSPARLEPFLQKIKQS